MNKQKNILIVYCAFYTMNSPRAFRTTELVKEFAKQGHKVTFLTVKDDEHHPSYEKEHGVTIKELEEPAFKTVDTGKGNSIGKFFRWVLRRGLLQAFEYPNIQLIFGVKRAFAKENAVEQFLNRNYSEVYRYNGEDRYRIENVSSQFLVLQKRDEE